MQKFILSATLCALIVAASPVALAQQTTVPTSTQSALLAQIESLMNLIASLQSQIKAAQGEIKEIAQDLKLGSESSDVKEIQELLASDPELFGAKPTGYYGPLTEAAIRKFQERYGLPVTGIVDEATREVMRELKMEKKNGMIPPGLVKSDEVKNRIKDRLKERWKECDFERTYRSGVCEKIKDKQDDENSDDDSDENIQVTRDDARRAVVDAQNALNTFRDSIDDMEDADAKEAIDTLRDAQKEMMKARRELTRNNPEEAYDAAKEVLEILSEDDDSDDSEEDEDDDSDEDEDEDDSDEDDD